jgi:hypothetical protein
MPQKKNNHGGGVEVKNHNYPSAELRCVEEKEKAGASGREACATNLIKSKWNNGVMGCDRLPIAVLVTADGQPYRFTGSSIPGVCNAVQTAFLKNGKWSNSTYELHHHAATAFVAWYEDWDTGEVWPQSSWEEAYRFLATKAPTLKPGLFEAFVRQHWPRAASKFDAVGRCRGHYCV